MAIASTFARSMPTTTSSSSGSASASNMNSFLLPKPNLTKNDAQLLDVLLHDTLLDNKIQMVNHWCQNNRRNRLSSIIDVSQRFDVLQNLVNTLQQTTNHEFQYNCLTLLSELQGSISHYDQQIYVPAIIQCFSSTSTEVQALTTQVLAKQIHTAQDTPTFLYIFTREGLKSNNLRIRVKSIESLIDILNSSHQHENLSSIFELLLQYCQDNQFRLNYHPTLLRTFEHLKRILSAETLSQYLELYPAALRRIYHSYVLPQIQNHMDENELTPRASVQVSNLRDQPVVYPSTGLANETSSLFPTSSLSFLTSFESTEIPSMIELIRSRWVSFVETDRVHHLNHLKNTCERYYQTLSTENSISSATRDKEFFQIFQSCLIAFLNLLNSITSKDQNLSIKVKLVLSTCLAWVIKHAHVNFCRKYLKTIINTFKNILFHGSSNNRQLAKFSVNLMLLLGNFVHPQVILQQLIDEHFLTFNYRIQLELLAIITAILIKYRQHNYENLPGIYQHLLPMLLSSRRELRHGAMECFTVFCTQMNSYKPITIGTMDSNSAIQLFLSNLEQISYEASHAFRFRLQRNLLPTLTDEGNITPGLSCASNPTNDPDIRFIVSASTNPLSTPQSTQSSIEPSPIPTKIPVNNNKLLLFAMPLVTKKTGEDDESGIMLMLDEEDLFHWARRPRLLIMRNREIPPLKGTDVVEVENHRLTTTNHYDSSASSLIPPSSTNNSHQTSNGSLVDLTVTGNNNYRPLTITEKAFTDEWAKKLSIKNPTRKDANSQSDNPSTTNPLQFRPTIARRPSPGRLPASHNLLITSHIHNYQEQKPTTFPLDFNQDENNQTKIDSNPLNKSESQSKSNRAVHSSSTRRKVDRLFSNGSEPEVLSARTLTPERNNENRITTQTGRETDPERNVTNKSINKPQLFSTKPRLARSGSKPKMEKVPPAPVVDFSSPHVNEHSPHVEVIGRGYNEEKIVPRRLSNENADEKPVTNNSKGKAKIIKGSVVSNPPVSTTNYKNFHDDDDDDDDEYHHRDDEPDIGVIGKAVHIPFHSKGEKNDEQIDLASDEFDSDSKENENFVEMNQSLSASFRLRVKQKTQEKIEQKERRRQDREIQNRQDPFFVNNTNTETPLTSSTSTSRYSSQPDLTTMSNELPPATTPKRTADPSITMTTNNNNNNSSILPNVPSQQRFRAFKNSMARSQTFNNRRELSNTDQRVAFQRPLSEDRITDQLRNPQIAYREAMESIASDSWEQKCSGLNLLQLLLAEYPDTITQNLHQVVLVLIAEIRNLRSQVARFALSTMADMFKYLQRNMDIELDITVKALIHKSADSNDFFKSDTEKCLQMMIDNVTLQKALQALIAGGASHRNPAARKTTAKYIYLVCEKLGPTKILNGSRDITERVLQVAASFASDGPPEIRWYGKKIYHMLMPYDELDSMMKHHLNATVYTNMCEILDNIRAKGGVGETPSESARNNVRRTLSNDKLGSNGLTSQFPSTRKINTADQVEQVREITKLLRSADFRDRLNGIEEFQKLCELETETAMQSLVPIFDGFNECLAHMNSKVVLKALNTMHQLVPILGDSLSSVINSALPLVAQNIASNNREIAELASDIIDAAIEYIDCGVLIQPLCILSQTSNLRVRPEIVLKLAIIVPHVCQRKPKQVEIHLLPAFWKLLSLLRGQNATTISSSASGPNSLNTSIHILTKALYTELGDGLLDRASSSSAVPPANLQLLRELCANFQTV